MRSAGEVFDMRCSSRQGSRRFFSSRQVEGGGKNERNEEVRVKPESLSRAGFLRALHLKSSKQMKIKIQWFLFEESLNSLN